jgi:pimeloyl-ACP methyl ester carboxylesterase
MTNSKLWRWVKIIAVIYFALGLAIYLLQDYIILIPTAVPANYNYRFDFPFREVNIAYRSNTNINIIQFQPPGVKPKGVILYFHGNRMNISRYRRFVPYFTRSGYEVWMIDYPGYGKSTGKFSEKMVYEWSLIMYNLALKNYSPSNIVIYGKSLGTGVASHLASIRHCRDLVLESPYYSIPDVFRNYIPIYPLDLMIRHRFPTFQYLPRVEDPIVIFHGTADRVIPFSHAERLKKLLKPTDKLITLEGGTHRNLYSFDEVPRTMDSLLQQLQQSKRN